MLTELEYLEIPSFITFIYNYYLSFENRWKTCDNIPVKHMVAFNL